MFHYYCFSCLGSTRYLSHEQVDRTSQGAVAVSVVLQYRSEYSHQATVLPRAPLHQLALRIGNCISAAVLTAHCPEICVELRREVHSWIGKRDE